MNREFVEQIPGLVFSPSLSVREVERLPSLLNEAACVSAQLQRAVEIEKDSTFRIVRSINRAARPQSKRKEEKPNGFY